MGLELGFPKSLLLIMFCIITMVEARRSNVFNVLKFGAVADGNTDNSKALLNAWRAACQFRGDSVVTVRIPRGAYLVIGPVVFQGPCIPSQLGFDLRGILRAPSGKSTLGQDSWVSFQYLKGLTLSGGGIFDGQGASAWPYNDCATNPNCPTLPVSLRFSFVNDSTVSYINSINSKSFHMSMFRCNNMRFEHINIRAPPNSPNTDGIHTSLSTNIHITDSTISTGDDCISMGSGTKLMNISNVFCGPGHGISIGSLGNLPNEDPVSALHIHNCTFTATTNGLRIKTWAPSKPGLVTDVTFEDIILNNASNPIIIDQNYCPSKKCDKKASSAVKISDVRYRNVRGSSATKVAVDLQCSSSVPCKEMELRDINIEYMDGQKTEAATSYCANVKGVHYGKQNPPACI